MNSTAVPSGFKAGFAQPLMTITAQVPESKDTCVVKFRDELEGSGKPQAMATQWSCGGIPHQTSGSHRSRSHDAKSHMYQEGLDQARRDAVMSKPKLRSMVKKPDPLATPATSPSKSIFPKKKNWEKRTLKE